MPPSSSPTLAIKACRSEAFIAYFNALDPRDSDKGGKGRGAAARVTSLEELADGRVWSRVLHSVDPTHFPDLLKVTTLSSSTAPTTWQSKLRLLKRIYHLLLSVPIPSDGSTSTLPSSSSRLTRSSGLPTSNSPLSNLQTPDLLVLSRHSPIPISLRSSMTVTSLQRLEEEVLKMSTIILGVMVVWGEGNEEVVKVIAGLDEKVQRGLKGVIEEVLEKTGYQTSINSLLPPSSSPPSDSDEFDQTIDKIVSDGIDIPNSSKKDVAKISQTLSRVVGVVDREGDEIDEEASMTYIYNAERSLLLETNDALRNEVERDEREMEGVKDELLRSQGGLKPSGIGSADMSRSRSGSSDESQREDPDLIGRSPQRRIRYDGGVGGGVDGLHEIIEELKAELDKKDDELKQTESSLEENINTLQNATQKIVELQKKASLADELMEQVDVLRHASEKLRKAENVNEKLKKKLDEMSDIRRELKSLEEQNDALVETNADLQAQNEHLRSNKPQAGRTVEQVRELEELLKAKDAEIHAVTSQVDNLHRELESVRSSAERERENLEIYQEHLRELEIGGRPKRQQSEISLIHGVTLSADLEGEEQEPLDKTGLKLRIRTLERELREARSGTSDGSRVITLEAVVEDLTKGKDRLGAKIQELEHDKSLLRTELNEARLSSSSLQGSDAVLALRKRLRDSAEEFECTLRKNRELVIRLEVLEKSHAAALADLDLVGLDQRDIIAAVRSSVSGEVATQTAEISRIKQKLQDAETISRTHLNHINELLLQKVGLQSEIIVLQKTTAGSRPDPNSKGMSSEVKAQMLQLHEKNVLLTEQAKTMEAKLHSAKRLLKEQDELIRKGQQPALATNPFEEAERSYKAQIEALKTELERAQQRHLLMLKAWGDLGQRTMRQADSKPEPVSWLAKQRQLLASGGTK